LVIRPIFEFHREMPLRTLILCFAMLSALLSKGQNIAANDTIPERKQNVETTEEIDGLLAFAGYLGKKLYGEVSEQFDEGEPEKKGEIKRVQIKLGPIKIERIEKR